AMRFWTTEVGDALHGIAAARVIARLESGRLELVAVRKRTLPERRFFQPRSVQHHRNCRELRLSLSAPLRARWQRTASGWLRRNLGRNARKLRCRVNL